MKIIDYIKLGFRNLWRRKSRTFLTVFAVVIGAVSVIIMLSLVIGAKNVATQQLESIDGLTLVSVSASTEIETNGNLLNTNTADKDIEKILNDTDLKRLKKVHNVIDATPITGVWIKSIKLEGQDKKYHASILAYDPTNKVLKINADVGRSLQPGDMNKVVIDIDTAKNFGYANNVEELIGKTLILYTEGSYSVWEGEPPKPPEGDNKEYWDKMQKSREIKAEIVGVVTKGTDGGQIYVTLDWARKLMVYNEWKWDDTKSKQFDEARRTVEELIAREMEAQKQVLYEQMKNEIDDQKRKELEEGMRKNMDQEVQKRLSAMGYSKNDFLVIIKNDLLLERGYSSILLRVDSTENVEKVGEEVKKLGYGAQTAKEMLDEIEKIFGLVGLIIGAIGGIVLFVAALGIINTMIMATYERTREIGVMRACGATRGDIRNLFIFEAGLIGFLGGTIGLLVSYGMAKVANTLINQFAVGEGLPINNLISFPLWLIISVIALTTLVGILAGLLPAIRASRLDPVEALRSE